MADSNSQKSSKGTFFLGFFLIFLIGFTAIFLFVFKTAVIDRRPINNTYQKPAVTYVPSSQDAFTVFYVLTADDSNTELDSFFLFRFDPLQNQVIVSCFSPITALNGPSGAVTAAKVLYDQGANGLTDAVESSMQVGIDYCMRSTKSAFIQTLDAVGPVVFNMPYTVTVSSGKYEYDIKQGTQGLTPDQLTSLFDFNGYQGGSDERYNMRSKLAASVLESKLKKDFVRNAQSIYQNIVNLATSDFSSTQFALRQKTIEYLMSSNGVPSPFFITTTFQEGGIQQIKSDCLANLKKIYPTPKK